MPRRRAQAPAADPNTIINATQSQWIARFGMNEFTTTAKVSINPTATMAQITDDGQGRCTGAGLRWDLRLPLK